MNSVRILISFGLSGTEIFSSPTRHIEPTPTGGGSPRGGRGPDLAQGLKFAYAGATTCENPQLAAFGFRVTLSCKLSLLPSGNRGPGPKAPGSLYFVCPCSPKLASEFSEQPSRKFSGRGLYSAFVLRVLWCCVVRGVSGVQVRARPAF